MTQIIPAARGGKSFMDSLLGGGAETLPSAVQQYFKQKQLQEMAQQEQRNVQGEQMFKQQMAREKQQADLQKALQTEQLKGKNNQSQSAEDTLRDQKAADTIRKYYGDKAADIFESATVGGKSEMYKGFSDIFQREEGDRGNLLNSQGNGSENLPQSLGDAGVSEDDDIDIQPKASKTSQKFIDYDRGTTPKERTRREDARYAKNLPLHQDLINRKKGLESEKNELGILEELSPQIGFTERLNINPQTGDLIIPAAASPEAQRFVKTINDMTRNAKDTYGARVTNFDLTQFMKRLPSLANSEEGRRQIIQQLQLINKINLAQDTALLDTIEDAGGVRKIDYDIAQGIGEKRSKKDTNKYISEFKNIGKSLDKKYNEIVNEKKSIVPKGRVAVQKADGSMGYIDKDKLRDFLDDNPGNKAL